jgi:D-serine deaminase-like pyridoxal phosphate-dependent protein
MTLAEPPTPSALVDLGLLLRNADRMRAVAAGAGVVLRPHVKTHKSPRIARIQHAGRPGPITVSTLAEAEAFAAAGFEDITYAVPIEPGKIVRALLLCRKIRLTLDLDGPEAAGALACAAAKESLRVPVLLEVDCGDHRCGVEPESAESVELARRVADSSGLDFRGLLTHAGHSYAATSKESVRRIAGEERTAVVSLAERLRAGGLEVSTVSVGSTPTMTHFESLDGVTEIRPGNYVFFDAFQASHGSCAWEDCAMTVLSAVVHRSEERIVLDAGAIALSKDEGPRDLDPSCGFGRVLDLEGSDTGLRISKLTQEHGEVALPSGFDASRFPPGARVRILPNHSCLTAAQHAEYLVLEGGEIVDRWPTIRGW